MRIKKRESITRIGRELAELRQYKEQEICCDGGGGENNNGKGKEIRDEKLDKYR